MRDAHAHDRPDADPACFHCGLPVPRGVDRCVTIDGQSRAMCCAGCQAVAQTIVAHGLTSYYRHRSALPARAEAVPPEVRELDGYAIPEVENALTRELPGDAREAQLMLEGIRCAACVWLIEQRLMRVPGVRSINVNYATQRATVCWDPRVTGLAAIIEAVAALGYRAHPYDGVRAETIRRDERQRALWRLFVAGFGMMQVMMYLVPVYLTDGEMTPDIEQLMRIASLILTLPVVFYAAAPFFAGAWRDLRARHLGMDVPVALGIAAAFAASAVATWTGSGQVYFDSVTMFVFLLLAARYLEMTARARAAMSQERLLHGAPRVCERLAAWPSSEVAEVVAVSSLRVGDHVRVRPGQAVPADGVVASGACEVDESLLTGESRARPKRVGDDVTGGSFNTGNPLVMRVTRVGADTMLAGMLRLLDRAAADKPRIARHADRIAGYFVLALMVGAAAVALAWYQVDPQRAFWVTVSLLVVSCPCALSLATPAALAAATGTLQARGVLVTRGNAIETLARATHFVFDKTGTLTAGQMKLVGVLPLRRDAQQAQGWNGCSRDDCLALAAALESGSAHPVAQAIAAAAPQTPRYRCAESTHIAGSGIEGVIDGRRVRIGAPPFVAALSGGALPPELAFVVDDIGVVALGDERGCIALFTFADTLRPHARLLVSGLARMGAQVHLLSGDRRHIVGHVARELGIANWRGEATPADKLDYVRGLQKQGAVVAVIGDGINDAAVLAGAHVSVAMGSGADIARGSGSVVLLCGRLDALLDAVRTARATLRVIRQNLAWAFAYNLTAVPLAAFGWVTPLAAGVGMAASSMLVVGNAMRLLRGTPPVAVPMLLPARALAG